MRIPFLAAAIYVASITIAPPIMAQEQAAAEALFRSAREAAARGDWRMACDRFAESHRLDPAPGTVLNLARCHEELGELASSWERYSEAAERLPADDRRSAYAAKKRDELEPRVPKVTLVAPAGEPECEVLVSGVGVEAATFGVPLPMDPGSIEIEVRAKGYETWTVQIDLEDGSQVVQELQLGAALALDEPSPEPSPEPKSRSARRTWGWVAVGAGSAGLAAGAAGGVWSLVELNTVNEHCEDGVCNSTGYDASQRGQSAVLLSAIGLGVGAIGLTTGYFLLKGTRQESARSTDLRFTPLAGGGMLSVSGSL